MGYAETQDEIIQARLGGRVQAGPRLLGAATPPLRAAQSAPISPPSVSARTATMPAAATGDDDLAAAIEAARRLRYASAVEQIAGAAGVTVEQLRRRGKGRELVEARRIVAAYLRRRDCSLPEIGRALNRDHTSVLNLLRTPSKVIRLYEATAP